MDDQEDLDEQGNEPKNWRRELEDRAKQAETKAEEVEKDAAEAKRELAILKAGLDPEDKRMKLFQKAYDGESTPEAIKEAWDEYFGEPASEEEVAAHERVADASSGAQVATPQSAADKVKDLRDRLYAGDRTVTQAEVEKAIRDAGGRVSASLLDTDGKFTQT